ncbi:MAG TPA: hypothetical protein GXX46_08085 [Peptococcaceae bacterium]|nr:hypothetical protein [Peptococcaceae bacterium]
MITEGRLSRFLAIALLTVTTVIIVSQGITTGTAAFVDYREKEKLTTVNLGQVNYQIINDMKSDNKSNNIKLDNKVEDLKSGDYKPEIIEKIAQAYNVEEEYLYYIVGVEKMFQLKPYELLALIAQESKFISQTKMDGGSYSYNTTQMKLNTAKTAYMAITEYYGKDIPAPTHELLLEDKYYAALLAGGYLKYLHDTYQDKYESYTAYHRGIGGRLDFFAQNGHYKSPYALQIVELNAAFAEGKTKIVNN